MRVPGRHARRSRLSAWLDASYGPVRHVPLVRDLAAELGDLRYVPAPALADPAIPPAGAGTRLPSPEADEIAAAAVWPAGPVRAGEPHVTVGRTAVTLPVQARGEPAGVTASDIAAAEVPGLDGETKAATP